MDLICRPKVASPIRRNGERNRARRHHSPPPVLPRIGGGSSSVDDLDAIFPAVPVANQKRPHKKHHHGRSAAQEVVEYNGVKFQRNSDFVFSQGEDPFNSVLFFGEEPKPVRVITSNRRNIHDDAHHLISHLSPEVRKFFHDAPEKARHDDLELLGETLLSYNGHFELTADVINRAYGEALVINNYRRKQEADKAWTGMAKTTHMLHTQGDKLKARFTIARQKVAKNHKTSEIMKKREADAKVFDKVEAALKSNDWAILKVAYDAAEEYASQQPKLGPNQTALMQKAAKVLHQMGVDSALRKAFEKFKAELEDEGAPKKLELDTRSKAQKRKDKKAALITLRCAIRKGQRAGATQSIVDEANWILWTVNEELQQRKDKKHLVSEVEEEAEIDGAHAAKLALEVTKADKAGVKRVMDGIAEAANKPVEEGNSLSKEATNARIREKMLELGQGNAPIKFQRQYKEARKQKPLPRGIYDREA